MQRGRWVWFVLAFLVVCTAMYWTAMVRDRLAGVTTSATVVRERAPDGTLRPGCKGWGRSGRRYIPPPPCVAYRVDGQVRYAVVNFTDKLPVGETVRVRYDPGGRLHGVTVAGDWKAPAITAAFTVATAAWSMFLWRRKPWRPVQLPAA